MNFESSNAEPKPDSSSVAPESKGSDAGAGSDSVSAPCRVSEPGPGSSPGSASSPNAGGAPEPEPALPPLTPQELRIYNRLAEQMDYFNLTLKQFLDHGLNLARYLSTHHTIEETHLYPLLARKMPEFRAAQHHHHHSSGRVKRRGERVRGEEEEEEGGDCELLRQHREIHRGMDEFEAYLRRCKNRECELELSVLKEKMDSWGDVLLRHLDQEVRDLGAENMRRYWTVEEMRSFPI
ncbi:hypothetical protein MMYC01_203327 [Madurella mycetomatis]|uniref:Hemerythrin-like domain-containing protein n=1 Tax=Madurella mycetomatis TaxID=100816 RepID=A0A175W8L3_9PEZI|nr:hypothetical protein MMYC01_203327 [Madurella mycetomatis]